MGGDPSKFKKAALPGRLKSQWQPPDRYSSRRHWKALRATEHTLVLACHLSSEHRYPSFPGWARQLEDGRICRKAGPQKCQVRRSALRLRSSQAELSCWELGALAPTHPGWSGPAEEGSPLLSIHLASLTPSPPWLDLLPSVCPAVLRL